MLIRLLVRRPFRRSRSLKRKRIAAWMCELINAGKPAIIDNPRHLRLFYGDGEQVKCQRLEDRVATRLGVPVKAHLKYAQGKLISISIEVL